MMDTTAAATNVLVLVTGIYATFTFFILIEMVMQRKEMQKQRRASLTPLVTGEIIPESESEGARSTLPRDVRLLRIRNVGCGPARSVRFLPTVQGPDEIPIDPIEYRRLPGDDLGSGEHRDIPLDQNLWSPEDGWKILLCWMDVFGYEKDCEGNLFEKVILQDPILITSSFFPGQ